MAAGTVEVKTDEGGRAATGVGGGVGLGAWAINVLLIFSASFRGRQTGQSCWLQCFQWAMICLEDEQCGDGHVLPDWQYIMCFSTFFIVLQWGSVHCTAVVFSMSLCWHLCACNNRTSCCCINFCLLGSAGWVGVIGEILGTLRNPGTLFAPFETLRMCGLWLHLF